MVDCRGIIINLDHYCSDLEDFAASLHIPYAARDEPLRMFIGFVRYMENAIILHLHLSGRCGCCSCRLSFGEGPCTEVTVMLALIEHGAAILDQCTGYCVFSVLDYV